MGKQGRVKGGRVKGGERVKGAVGEKGRIKGGGRGKERWVKSGGKD